MARLLTRRNEPEPNVWRWMGEGEAQERRKTSRARLRRGTSIEFDTAHHRDIEQAEHDGRGTATLETPDKPRGRREARETIDILAKTTLDWVLAGTKDEVKTKVKLVKRSSGMTHLTDEEAAEQLSTLALKLARMDAEHTYATQGYNRPAVI